MGGILVQTLVTIVVTIANIIMGYSVGWVSNAIPVLQSDMGPIRPRIPIDMLSYVASIPMLACVPSILLTTRLADTIGRQKSQILSGILYVIAWALLATSTTVVQLLISRVLIGVAGGIFVVPAFSFISEISQVHVRGVFSTILTSGFSFGVLVSYLVGGFFDYDTLNYVGVGLSVVFLLLILFVKESPAFLLVHGRYEQAVKSLKFYRGTDLTTPEILDELELIRNSDLPLNEQTAPNTDEEKSKLDKKEGVEENKSVWKILWTTKHVQRALLMCTVYVFLSIFMGSIAVQAFAGQLFREAAPDLSYEIYSLAVACVHVLGHIVSFFLVDNIGRRTLTISTGVGASASLYIISGLLHWPGSPEWMVPAFIILFIIFVQSGIGIMPYVVLADSFGTKMKTFSTTVVFTAMYLANFIVISLYLPIMQYYGVSTVFLTCAIVASIATIVHALFLKETKGIPVEQVQAMYEQGFLYHKNVSAPIPTNEK